MTLVNTSPDHLDNAPSVAPRNARWRLPGGGAAADHARRAIRATLTRWGLGPIADDVLTLVNQLIAGTAAHGRDSIDLHLELRESVRLLVGQVRSTALRADPAPGHTGAQTSVRTGLAVTYGRRLEPGSRGGPTATWYTHAFTW